MIHGVVLSFAGIVWGLLSVVVFFVALLMTAVILIQDSKDTGLTSAFGGAGGGNALLGARMQRDLAKITAWLAGVLAVCLLVMGIITRNQLGQSIGEVGAGGAAPPPPAATTPATPEAPLPFDAFPSTPGGAGATPPSGAGTTPAPPAGTGAAPPPAAGAGAAPGTGTGTGTSTAPGTDASPAPPATDTAPAKKEGDDSTPKG